MLQPHPDEVFDRTVYSVDGISEAQAKRFVVDHHYSRSYPAAVERIGLFGRNAELEGVAVFSVPMNQRVIPAHCGVPADQGLELGRFVLIDRAPRNSESFMLGACFRLLRKVRPHLRAIVSYSDPVPRRTAEGRLLTPGHVGIIYQAFSGRYLGRGTARTLHLTRDGQVVSPRTLSKIRLGERGWEAGQASLEAQGAPRRLAGESGPAWVARVLASGLLRPLRHPGNHVYVWPLAKNPERQRIERGFAPPLLYPKAPDRRLELAVT